MSRRRRRKPKVALSRPTLKGLISSGKECRVQLTRCDDVHNALDEFKNTTASPDTKKWKKDDCHFDMSKGISAVFKQQIKSPVEHWLNDDFFKYVVENACQNDTKDDLQEYKTQILRNPSNPWKPTSLQLWGTHHSLVRQRKEKKPRPYPCQLCEKPFRTKHYMLAHLNRHTGERPFKCPVCSKDFFLLSEVTVHLRTHTGERPYSCGFCEKRFLQKSHLMQHERTHTGERPYKCSDCGLQFVQQEHLYNHHMREHAPVLPYLCHICNKGYVHACHLKVHMRIHLQSNVKEELPKRTRAKRKL